ncbi:hypothetical protein [Vibrio agarivorans]|uniref:Uncharacterized protein n=1 Tax=Vibrio agarivorans TaxID=153622 RepID=A0ABT7Y736_9VIBR|nr:hypothetical protein [Vibrio agarivorans]MDN2483812.1 hypothetical protein [Vibrio agarivorans]
MTVQRYSLFKLQNQTSYWQVLYVTLNNGDSLIVSQSGDGPLHAIPSDFARGGALNVSNVKYTSHQSGLKTIRSLVAGKKSDGYVSMVTQATKAPDEYIKRVIHSWLGHFDDFLDSFALAATIENNTETENKSNTVSRASNKQSSEQSDLKDFITLLLA